MLYVLGMRNGPRKATEHLIRVATTRRGKRVELLVHYEVTKKKGCDTIRIFRIEDTE